MDGFNVNKKVKEKIFSNCADQHSWLKTTKTEKFTGSISRT